MIEEGEYKKPTKPFRSSNAVFEEAEPEYLTRDNKGSLPSSFCWTNKNGHSYIGPIRGQGDCGSCYAFSACAAAEGTYNWATGKYDGNRAEFSESFIAWCLGRLSQYSSHFFGCDGADYDYAELDALCAIGICSAADFPYQESDPGSCTHWGDPRKVFASWHRVSCEDIDGIKTAIMTYGVVDAAVKAGGWVYNSGIYEDSLTNCPGSPCDYTSTDHAIGLVGWNDNSNPETNGYWILRNSWGTSWGENGYMRIKYRSSRVACEVCYLVYPSNTSYGTPYSWLGSYFTNNYDVAETNDVDNDGLLTWEEYVTGTDPTNQASVFAVLNQGYLNASNYIVWYGTTNSGVTNAFGMYRGTNLIINTWNLITKSIARNPTGTNTWWDTNAPASVPVFYRPMATNAGSL